MGGAAAAETGGGLPRGGPSLPAGSALKVGMRGSLLAAYLSKRRSRGGRPHVGFLEHFMHLAPKLQEYHRQDPLLAWGQSATQPGSKAGACRPPLRVCRELSLAATALPSPTILPLSELSQLLGPSSMSWYTCGSGTAMEVQQHCYQQLLPQHTRGCCNRCWCRRCCPCPAVSPTKPSTSA